MALFAQFFQHSIRAMPARDIHQHHRASTPLELLFDLVTVIAVAAAAGELHHAAAHDHLLQGAGQFVLAFFAIWWAWMNYSWFASAYDNDDAVFRLLTLLVMAGSLVMAAGIRPFFQHSDLSLIVWGFVLMRLAMVLFWLRAGKHHTERRRTTQFYAVGLLLVQSYWLALWAFQPASFGLLALLFVLGAVAELAVPALAERQGITPWHRHHMMERYGLLNLIVLGETLLAGSQAIAELHERLPQLSANLTDPALTYALSMALVPLMALVLVFSLWWLYFSREEHLQQQSYAMAFAWGYGHLLVYAAGASVGAGVAVLVEQWVGQAHLSDQAAAAALSVPVSVYLFGLWLVRDRFIFQGLGRFVLLTFAAGIPLVTAGVVQLCSGDATHSNPAALLAALLTTTVGCVAAVALRSSHACCVSQQLGAASNVTHKDGAAKHQGV